MPSTGPSVTASAARPRARAAWVGWGAVAAIAVTVLAGCGSPAQQPAVDSASAPRQSLDYDGGWVVAVQSGTACELRWSGQIHAGAVARLRLALTQLDEQRCARRTLVLDGVDGTLGDAMTIGAMLRNRGWDTALAPASACRTPCWLVFAAGVRRHMPGEPKPARVVFSQIPPDADFGHQSCATELSRTQQLTLTRYLRAMLPAPTATTVYQKLLAADCHSADAYDARQSRLIGLATDQP